MSGRYYEHRTGQMHYVRRGLGDPLLLVHNLYPGASYEEYEHNIDALARQFTVYAIDLLGFGLSEAPPIKYTQRTYITLIHDFLRDVVHEPAGVVSAGLSCAYAAEAAVRNPSLVRSMVLICPRSEPVGLDAPRWVAPLRRMFLSNSIFGSGFYETMAGRAELAAYLNNCFHDRRNVTQELIDRLHVHAHRPGSMGPYASLITGYLDSSILKVIPHTMTPTLLIWGRQARPTPVEHSVRLTALLRVGRLEVVENAGAWVHYEQSRIVNNLITSFCSTADQPATKLGA
jgi:pimeloyl-ACP methyl ester carboxylesterase